MSECDNRLVIAFVCDVELIICYSLNEGTKSK